MYRAVKSNGDISKVLFLDDTIWQGVKEGMPPELQNIKDNLYLEYGSNRIYGDKTLYLQEQKYKLIPSAPNISSFDIKFSTSNSWVVLESGKVFSEGVANITVTVSLKTPNPGYKINSFSKAFKITVVR